MKSLKQDKKVEIFTQGIDTKSKAEAKRVAKEVEESKINEINEFVDGLIQTYGKYLEDDEYLKLGYFKIVKKDGEVSIKFKR